jgi:large subunit ribosomal protein L29
MPIRHATEFREMTDSELALQLHNAHDELFRLRFQLATRKQKNHQRVRIVKREVARMLTVARERELQALYDQYMSLYNEAAALEEGEMPETPAEGATVPLAPAEAAPAPRRRGLFGRS